MESSGRSHGWMSLRPRLSNLSPFTSLPEEAMRNIILYPAVVVLYFLMILVLVFASIFAPLVPDDDEQLPPWGGV